MAIKNNQTQSKYSNLLETFGNHPNIQFLEKAAIVLKDLGSEFEKTYGILFDGGDLGIISLDYKYLAIVDNIATALKEGKINAQQAASKLLQYLKFIEYYSKEFARKLQDYVPSVDNEGSAGNILKNLSDHNKIVSNLQAILEYSNRTRPHIKSKLKALILLINRFDGERYVLRSHASDIQSWNLYFHKELSFFTDRIEVYFKGGMSTDKINFTGIDFFKDDDLKTSVMSNKNIRMLIFLSSVTNRMEDQIRLISEMTSLLKKDIDGQRWNKIDSTKEFISNIPKYCQKFEEYGNKTFSGMLKENIKLKDVRTFEWIDLLKGMMLRLENFAKMKNSVIQNAGFELKTVFESRILALDKSIERLSAQLVMLFNESSKESSLNVLEGISSLKKSVDKAWKARKKELKKIEVDVKTAFVAFKPLFDAALSDAALLKEASVLAGFVQAEQSYIDARAKIATRLGGVPDYKKFSLLGMLAHNLARHSNDIIPGILATKDDMERKADKIEKEDYAELKKKFYSLLETYEGFFIWSTKSGLKTNSQAYLKVINDLKVILNGRN